MTTSLCTETYLLTSFQNCTTRASEFIAKHVPVEAQLVGTLRSTHIVVVKKPPRWAAMVLINPDVPLCSTDDVVDDIKAHLASHALDKAAGCRRAAVEVELSQVFETDGSRFD